MAFDPRFYAYLARSILELALSLSLLIPILCRSQFLCTTTASSILQWRPKRKKVDDSLTDFEIDENEDWTYNTMQFVNRRYKVAEKVDKEGHPYEETRWSFVGGTHDLRDTIAEDIVEVLNYNVGMNAQSRSGMDDTDERSDFIEQLTHHLRCIFIRLKQTIETDQANPIRTALVLEAVFMKVLHAPHFRPHRRGQ